MKVSHHVLSDVGRKRRSNEDAFLADPGLGLFVVADGMGGHAAGEVASRITVEHMHRFVRERWERLTPPEQVRQEAALPEEPAGSEETTREHPPVPITLPPTELLKLAIAAANREVLAAAREHRENRGMASTVVSVLLQGDLAYVAHAGDSRAYLLRGGILQSLTADHSWVGEQVAAGALSLQEARNHPLRNMVTRAVGGRGDLDAEVTTFTVQPGDVVLLCSDGLTGMVPDDEMARLLLEALDPQSATRRLVDEANDRGGHDNITVLVVRIDGDGA